MTRGMGGCLRRTRNRCVVSVCFLLATPFSWLLLMRSQCVEYYEQQMDTPIVLSNQNTNATPPRWTASQAHQYLYGQMVYSRGYIPLPYNSQPGGISFPNVMDLGGELKRQGAGLTLISLQTEYPQNFHNGGVPMREEAVPFTLQQGFRPSNDISPSGYSHFIQSMSLPVEGYPTQGEAGSL